ncbi:MAG: MBL fold metallo-hydrolase [Bacteroidia bacterium]
MLKVKSFTFNPFGENTYIVYSENGECIIFDPGMYLSSEQEELSRFIDANQLKPIHLINTHCHIDHIFGNTYCADKYNLKLKAHQLEKSILAMGEQSAMLYGLKYHKSVEIKTSINEKETIEIGQDQLELRFTPGHSPGSLSFYNQDFNFVIVGDALFKHSIGRTDLPGGDHQTLINSIKSELLSLPDQTIVYSGHGDPTTIGEERKSNPFLQ